MIAGAEHGCYGGVALRKQSHTVGPVKETAIVGAGQAMHVSARMSDVIVAVRATCAQAASHAMADIEALGLVHGAPITCL